MDSGRLVILAGGISSRMKRAADPGKKIDSRLLSEADHKEKSMLGVGDEQRPFLDYLLFNARESGYRDVVIVINEQSNGVKSYYGNKEQFNEFHGLSISYAVQRIPPGREKPLGTADALCQALQSRKDWTGQKFTVCNSDNLYSTKALNLLLNHEHPNALIDYERDALEFNSDRIEAFAVIAMDEEQYVTDIIEKPTPEEVNAARRDDGRIGVSMNIFSFSYEQIVPFLEAVPLHPVRREKEIPTAVKMMVAKYPKSVYAYPLAEHVPDLTNKTDIMTVKEYLDMHFPKPLFG
ncbi:MAG TPA: sugar phosphate nucleotidyltransferase [Balneolales bacterium]|nr:sugar phosphate nucleotidyltransferase [Balneolales bacterium]